MATFNWDMITAGDYLTARAILGETRPPDVVIAPDGKPYLYRWHLIPRNDTANVYFHVQVASDPERGLHDHPYDNQSVILSGGYREIVQENAPYGAVRTHERMVGDCIHRPAKLAHRLILPSYVPYTMTLFSTGPRVRAWGFWLPSHRGANTWHPWEEFVVEIDGCAVNTNCLNERTP